ncbi:hypothetical protein KL937_004022 [Ogataea polymorpha]|nr:hypothetical protein KL937_004022 [Ogataea polymorpha]KAG7914750.1 hypothetical protein KL927_004419 [Ogataea polymorpha]KAG7933148.1 hypothetical protein KL904_004204 [Ogataea polymorpha]
MFDTIQKNIHIGIRLGLAACRKMLMFSLTPPSDDSTRYDTSQKMRNPTFCGYPEYMSIWKNTCTSVYPSPSTRYVICEEISRNARYEPSLSCDAILLWYGWKNAN